MCSKRDGYIVDSLRSEEYIAEPLSFNMGALESYKEFALQSISELTESGLGVLHQAPDGVQRLYLISGVFRLGHSGVTRLS